MSPRQLTSGKDIDITNSLHPPFQFPDTEAFRRTLTSRFSSSTDHCLHSCGLFTSSNELHLAHGSDTTLPHFKRHCLLCPHMKLRHSYCFYHAQHGISTWRCSPSCAWGTALLLTELGCPIHVDLNETLSHCFSPDEAATQNTSDMSPKQLDLFEPDNTRPVAPNARTEIISTCIPHVLGLFPTSLKGTYPRDHKWPPTQY